MICFARNVDALIVYAFTLDHDLFCSNWHLARLYLAMSAPNVFAIASQTINLSIFLDTNQIQCIEIWLRKPFSIRHQVSLILNICRYWVLRGNNTMNKKHWSQVASSTERNNSVSSMTAVDVNALVASCPDWWGLNMNIRQVLYISCWLTILTYKNIPFVLLSS